MKLAVFHKNELGQFSQVAAVDLSDAEFDNMTRDDALEYAWRWTQNLAGSWSMKLAEDANDRVTVTAEFPQYMGRVYGHRSTDLGDLIVLEGSMELGADGTYEVAAIGFTRKEVAL